MAKNGLGPDERELARNPPRWVGWTAYLVSLALPAALVLMVLADDTGRMQDMVPILYILGGATALQLLILPMLFRWRIMVTDSRMLIRRGLLRRDREEIDRADIESTSHEGFMLRIRTGARTVQVPCHPFFGARILAAIQPETAAPAASPGMSGGPLASGEQVRLRPKPVWVVSAAAAAMAFLPVTFNFRRLFEDEGALDVLDYLLLAGFPTAGALVGAVLAFVMHRSQKSWLVTGRRVMNIQGVFRRRIEDIPLDWIEKTEFDGATLTVIGNGRRLEFTLGDVRGEDLNRVLGRWFPWRGQPAVSAGAVLHGGETLLLQRPRKWLTRLGLAGPLVFLFGLALFLNWYLLGDAADLVLLIMTAFAGLGLIAMIPIIYRISAWTLLVTDRRVLLRRGHDRKIYDELPLDDITNIEEGDADIPRVTLHGRDRDYIVSASSAKAATRIRETIEQARGEARWRA